MVKKKQRSSKAAGDGEVSVVGVSVSSDVKSVIYDHSLFFDSLVELIPAKFYIPPDDNQEKVWPGSRNKAAKAKAKKLTAENTKKARRDRLDPVKSSKTTLDLIKESVEKEEKSEKIGGGGDGDGDGVTYEELRQRLRRKIEELRAGRGEVDVERREEKEEERKRKREEWSKRREEWIQKRDKNDAIEKEVSVAAQGIEFGKVKLGDEDWELKNRKKRKLSKEEELEKARKLEEAKKDPEKGKLVAEKHSWEAATSRAMGVKVHDNPKLIKESIQREKRKHKKSVENWKDQVKRTQGLKKEKQDKRKGNIQSQIEKKKKMKIERREKKLMKKRPGFEGRKDGYINGAST